MLCKVSIDTYRCNSCGACVEACPQVFRMNAIQGKAEPRNERIECRDDLHLAAAMCPEKCIEITEEG